MMEAKPFETKCGGIRSIYHNEDLLRFNIITKDNVFTVFVMDGVFHAANPVALPVCTSSFSHLLHQMSDDHQSL